MIRRFPQHKRDLEALRSGSVTPNYSGMQVSHEASRTTEDVALRCLPREEQREYDAVDFALRSTIANYPRDYHDRLRLIGVLYWGSERVTLEGAAMRIPCSVDTAKKWNSAFLQLVDACAMVMSARFY